MTLTPAQESRAVEGNDGAAEKPKYSSSRIRTKPESKSESKEQRAAERRNYDCGNMYCFITTSEDNKSQTELSSETLTSISSERVIADHNYCSEDFDNNLTWAFTQPCSSHVEQMREIQKCLHDNRVANSGWNYANPMKRYVELCSDDPRRCSSDIDEVLEKYFKVSSFANVSVQRNNPLARRKCEERGRIEIELLDSEMIIETQIIDDAEDKVIAVDVKLPENGTGNSVASGNGNGSETKRADKKVSLLGVHFLQDKKMLLLQTSHTVRRTARERYQHLAKVLRFPSKIIGSSQAIGGNYRQISRFLNDDCWTDASGRRETCIVNQDCCNRISEHECVSASGSAKPDFGCKHTARDNRSTSAGKNSSRNGENARSGSKSKLCCIMKNSSRNRNSVSGGSSSKQDNGCSSKIKNTDCEFNFEKSSSKNEKREQEGKRSILRLS